MKRFELSRLLVFLFASVCQSALAPVYASEGRNCTETLSELSWTLREGGAYSELNSDQSGKALHGLQCSEAQIVAWFEENSWVHLKTVSPSGESFGSGARRYKADRGLVFCLPRRFPFKWLTNGCFAQASVSLFDGKITNLTAGPSI